MEVYESKDLKRDSNKITSKLKVVGNAMVTSVDLRILVYHKFVEKNLTVLDNTCKVLGIICVLDDDGNYAIMTAPGQMEVEPDEIEDVEVDGEHYFCLVIGKGSTLISDTTVVKESSTIKELVDLFVLKGKVPFFLGYEDMITIFTSFPKYAGTGIGSDSLPFEVFTAMMSRDVKDPTKDFRTTIKTHADAIKRPPKWVGLMNIYYSFGSTLSKIAGSYFKTGTLVATVNQNDKPTKLEKILKG